MGSRLSIWVITTIAMLCGSKRKEQCDWIMGYNSKYGKDFMHTVIHQLTLTAMHSCWKDGIVCRNDRIIVMVITTIQKNLLSTFTVQDH